VQILSLVHFDCYFEVTRYVNKVFRWKLYNLCHDTMMLSSTVVAIFVFIYFYQKCIKMHTPALKILKVVLVDGSDLAMAKDNHPT
jgi:hypothetical protein